MISVIIPTYNRGEELPRAIESVIAQTFKDWELIIVDDGSKDDTYTVVEQYLKSHSNIFYHKYLNMGASVARNIGVSLSKGELIAFLDSDDIWTEKRLATVFNRYLKEKGSNKFYLTDFKNNHIDHSLFNKEFLENKYFKQMILASNFLGGTINMVIPRRILFELNGFDNLMTSTEDHDLYIRLVQNYEVSYVPGEFAIFFLDTSNRISGKNNRRLLGQLFYYQKHKSKMSTLTRLLVMKKNALLAYYIKSPQFFKYAPAWAIVWVLRRIYRFDDELELFLKDSLFLNRIKEQ